MSYLEIAYLADPRERSEYPSAGHHGNRFYGHILILIPRNLHPWHHSSRSCHSNCFPSVVGLWRQLLVTRLGLYLCLPPDCEMCRFLPGVAPGDYTVLRKRGAARDDMGTRIYGRRYLWTENSDWPVVEFSGHLNLISLSWARPIIASLPQCHSSPTATAQKQIKSHSMLVSTQNHFGIIKPSYASEAPGCHDSRVMIFYKQRGILD
jgi:hypothetical protein